MAHERITPLTDQIEKCKALQGKAKKEKKESEEK